MFMIESKELEGFWAGKHQNADAMYLSGNGEATLDKLHIRGILFTVVVMLNIGVGFGAFERFMRDKVKRLDSLDITEYAYTAVAGVADHFYLNAAELPGNTYDLVTELLVAQHLPDPILKEHLTWGIRALNKDGIFALQTAAFLHPPSADELAKNNTLEAMKAGSVKRNIPDMLCLIKSCGGVVTRIRSGPEYPAWGSVWMVYHIRRET
jgi:hypothetical protein